MPGPRLRRVQAAGLCDLKLDSRIFVTTARIHFRTAGRSSTRRSTWLLFQLPRCPECPLSTFDHRVRRSRRPAGGGDVKRCRRCSATGILRTSRSQLASLRSDNRGDDGGRANDVLALHGTEYWIVIPSQYSQRGSGLSTLDGRRCEGSTRRRRRRRRSLRRGYLLGRNTRSSRPGRHLRLWRSSSSPDTCRGCSIGSSTPTGRSVSDTNGRSSLSDRWCQPEDSANLRDELGIFEHAEADVLGAISSRDMWSTSTATTPRAQPV